MTSKARKEFDTWFVKNYDRLCIQAERFHRDPNDLVHHTYLRVVKQSDNVLDNPEAYFRRAMLVNATRGDFKKLYRILEGINIEIVDDEVRSDKFWKEEIYILAKHLSWFDRTVLHLYLEGHVLTEVSKETEIPVTTLWQSVSRSKKKLKDAILDRKKAERTPANM